MRLLSRGDTEGVREMVGYRDAQPIKQFIIISNLAFEEILLDFSRRL